MALCFCLGVKICRWQWKQTLRSEPKKNNRRHRRHCLLRPVRLPPPARRVSPTVTTVGKDSILQTSLLPDIGFPRLRRVRDGTRCSSLEDIVSSNTGSFAGRRDRRKDYKPSDRLCNKLRLTHPDSHHNNRSFESASLFCQSFPLLRHATRHRGWNYILTQVRDAMRLRGRSPVYAARRDAGVTTRSVL